MLPIRYAMIALLMMPVLVRAQANPSPAARREPAVMLVTDGNLFLEKALAALSLQKTRTVKPAEYSADAAREYDVVVFDRFQPDRVPPVGSFLYVAAVPPPSEPTVLSEGARPVKIADLRVTRSDHNHPLLRQINLGKIAVKEALKLTVPDGWTIVVDGDKAPLIITRRQDMKIQTVIAFDLMNSNWPAKPSFPVFIRNAADWLLEPMAQRTPEEDRQMVIRYYDGMSEAAARTAPK